MSIVTCPKCKHHFKGTTRNCAKCKKNIGRHDKWHFRKDGRIEHRNCLKPEYYA